MAVRRKLYPPLASIFQLLPKRRCMRMRHACVKTNLTNSRFNCNNKARPIMKKSIILRKIVTYGCNTGLPEKCAQGHPIDLFSMWLGHVQLGTDGTVCQGSFGIERGQPGAVAAAAGRRGADHDAACRYISESLRQPHRYGLQCVCHGDFPAVVAPHSVG